MQTHEMAVKTKDLNLIKKGKKDIELCLYDTTHKLIQPGDQIIFSSGKSKCIVEVKGLLTADTFNTLFKHMPIERAGFKSIEEAETVINEIYSVKDQEEFGVVGIAIEVIK